MGTVIASGIASGCLIGLVAMGIVMVFRTSGIVNFAQGELMTLAAYLYVPLANQHVNSALEIVLVVVLGAVAGFLFFLITEFLLRRAETLIQIMATFAMSLLIVSVLAKTQGSQTEPAADWFQGGVRFTVAGVHLTGAQVTQVVVMLVLLAVVSFVLHRTEFGRAVEAVTEDRGAASLCGISPRATVAATWVIGAALTALAGLLYAPLSGVTPSMGANVLFPAFVGATIGGFVSLAGAAAGGVAVGLVSGLANYFLGGGSVSTVAVFAVLIVVLLLKPSGFGGRVLLSRV